MSRDWTCPNCGLTCAPDEGICMMCGAEEALSVPSLSDDLDGPRNSTLVPKSSPGNSGNKP